MVALAEELWRRRWQEGILMPNGDRVHITEADLYHLIVDGRIARKSERIELVLRDVYEIHEAREGRRRILSRWQEDGVDRYAFGILDGDRLWTVHLIEARDLRKYRNENVLWRP
jgi:hypothetical protein